MLIGDKIYNMANNTTITDLSTEFKQAFNITSSIFLNSGAQKEVFCVERNGAKCILKLFKNFGERDIREIEIYKKFHHLNGIPKIIETKEHDGKIVVFEEYIDGTTLEDACREYKSDSKKISDLIIKIIDILKPLWEGGIVHRDIKPSNIIIASGNNPFVIDFGIAKDFESSSLTTVGFQPHSWNFAAPEQLLADKGKISYRTDFFSLGVLAYYLFYQKLPFGDTRQKIEEVFQSKNLALAIDPVCQLNKMISETLYYNPSDRPSKIETLKELLNI